MSKNWKWDGEKVEALFRKKIITYLHACGNLLQNQMVMNCHVQTGLLRNSVNYQLFNSERGNFGNMKGEKKGRYIPNEDEMVSKADDYNAVRVGSGVVYAERQEKHNGWASRSLDEVQANAGFEQLALKIFRGMFA